MKKGNSYNKKTDSVPQTSTTGIPKPQMTLPIPQRQAPLLQPQLTNTPPTPQPHPINTEEAWRQHKTAPKSMDQVPNRETTEAQDPNKLTKPAGGYHFTSTIQEMIDSDVIQ